MVATVVRWMSFLGIAAVLAAACQGSHPLSGQNRGRAGPASTPVAWIDAPAPTYSAPDLTPSPYPTSSPPCVAAQMRVSEGMGGGAGGNDLIRFELANVGAAACLLQGLAGVSAIDPSGRRVTLHPAPDAFGGPLLPADIDPGKWGYLDFWTSHNCPPGDPGFETTYRSLTLVLPTGGLLETSLSLAAGTCGLGMDHLGLPATYPAPPSPRPATPDVLTVQLSLPAVALAGSSLLYTVTLTNPTAGPVGLDPCPSYTETLGYPNDVTKSFYLNCRAAPVIEAGSSLTFRMKLAIPGQAVPGQSKFGWAIDSALGPYGGGVIAVLAAA